MPTALVTGGSGFLGGLLVERLLGMGWRCINIDLETSDLAHPDLTSLKADIRNRETLEAAFRKGPVDVVFHCAAILAHVCKDPDFLWSSNVDGTRAIAEQAKRSRVSKVIYTSSNCLWGERLEGPVREEDEPRPAELYGESKWQGEKILAEYSDSFHAITLRCPTIIDAGRLGLLSILFEFISEGRKVWVVGDGGNRYQFIYAQDLIDAMLRACEFGGGATFGIGSDNVKSMRQIYEWVIAKAASRSRVASLPKGPAIALMKLAHSAGLSPLGPYHYKMIAEDFSFDTTRIKHDLGWSPTLTNEEMLLRAYEYYHANEGDIRSRTNASAHRQPAKMGVIRLLKWAS
jgi:UDP-glucose 4-epimerase